MALLTPMYFRFNEPIQDNLELKQNFITLDGVILDKLEIDSNMYYLYSVRQFRIFKLTIDYNSDFSSETHIAEKAYTFENVTINSSNLDERINEEPETLLLNDTNLAQFEIIMDNDKKYIIAASHGELWVDGVYYVGVKPVRDKLDFMIYEIDSRWRFIFIMLRKKPIYSRYTYRKFLI